MAEYREVLLLSEDVSRIIRAYPLPGQPAQQLVVTDEAVYCSRQGDGALPDSMLCRIDRADLDITGRIFPYRDGSDYGSGGGSAIPPGDWTVAPVSPVVVMETLEVDGWVVTTGHDGEAIHDPESLERLQYWLVEPTHRVVNVASGDFLNVRRSPGADEQLYARLAPTYSGVRVTGNIRVVDDGGEWWEVRLLDPVRLFDLQEPLHGGPIVGWVNSAFLEPYDPAFATVPACAGIGFGESLTSDVNRDDADHIFQIREYELADDCLRVVITFGTEFDDSGIVPRYDMIGTDMRPVGNVPAFDIQQVQGTTMITLEGVDHAWTTQSSNVLDGLGAVDAFAVRGAEGAVDISIPVIGLLRGVTSNPATGQLIVDITRSGAGTPLPSAADIRLIGDPVFTAGGILEFIGLARPFEATVGIQIRQGGRLVVDEFAMATDWTEAWGLFRYRAVGLDPEQPATVAITDESDSEPVGLTFDVESGLDTSRSTGEQLIDASDLEVADALVGYARGDVPFRDLSLAEEVALGLGNTQLLVVDSSDLASASTWIIQQAEFAESVGPFDILDPLRDEPGISQVNVAPRPHCVGPPLEFGPEWSQGRHLVIEPTTSDSCALWYAIHVLVNDRDQIQAVTLDLFGP